jgi:archaellum component FlaC
MFNRLMEEMGTMRKEFAKCLTNVDELKTRVEKVESAVDALSRNLAEVDSEVTLNSGTPQLNELKKVRAGIKGEKLCS